MRRYLALLVSFIAACESDGQTSTSTSEDTSVVLPDVALPDATTLPEVTITAQPLGGICQTNEGCQSGYCNTTPSGGYCTQRCGGEFGTCPEDSSCVYETDSDGTKRNLCLKTCVTNGGCRTDQFCPSEVKLCTPRCQPDSCNEGYECNTLSGRCVPEAACEPVPEVCDGVDQNCNKYIDEGCGPPIARPPHVEVHDFGAVQLGGEGLSRPFSFLVDEGTASFTIVAMSIDHPADYLTLYALTAPDGTDLMGQGNPYEAPNRAFPSFSAFTVQVPNTDAYELATGRYNFSFYAFPDDAGNPAPIGDGWVYVFENRRKGATASKLDVNYWFVGIPGLTAASAQTNAKFGQLVERFETILGTAGITIGTSRYFDVTGNDAQRFTIVDTGQTSDVDEHAELLTLTESLAADNWGVSFFFVQGFTGWQLLGKAGGIPGPPMVHGTYNSGVVVSLADYLHYPQENVAIQLTAETMAHELGHQLGLYHTTEGDGRIHDHVLDTPECPSSYDSNRDGLMDPSECAVRGATNLMFWAASLEHGITAGQRKVLHRNPTLRD
ncbi:MAG: hypothetical protein IT385_14885 [Deltaproteobacteria bacterium]|nr:hypothetical protein [Deltaproteobacteria bacterium]